MTDRIEVATVVTRMIAGAGGVALRGARALDPERYHVTFVTGEGGPLTAIAEQAGMDVRIEPSLVAPISPRQDLIALRRLRELFSARHFDVVHTHSAKAGAVGRLAAYQCGVPVIAHSYHGFPFHEFQGRARRGAYVAIERRLARMTDVVLCIGAGVATEALRRGLADSTTLRVVTPVVESRVVPATAASRRAARQELRLPEGAEVVGTVGRLDYQKAPEQFVEAIAALRARRPRAHGVWIGSGPLLQETESRIRALGLDDHVTLAGERSDVPDLLPALDVFAMSSRYEGLPCAVVEAMRCGIPVVVPAVNSVPDLVVPGETGVLVRPGRPRELAAALAGVLEEPSRAAAMVARGRERASTAFDESRLGQALDEEYTRALRARLNTMAGVPA
jgi:glycosyltransferase involved in cell wall biosynthesis